jgi:hypothetical protein
MGTVVLEKAIAASINAVSPTAAALSTSAPAATRACMDAASP